MGPGIYGIAEASRYYFGKELDETLRWAKVYTLPVLFRAPKRLYAFLPDGTLRPGLENYFNSLGRMMMGKGFLQPDSSSYGFYTVHLKESQRSKVVAVDSAAASRMLNAPPDDDNEVSAYDRRPTAHATAT